MREAKVCVANKMSRKIGCILELRKKSVAGLLVRKLQDSVAQSLIVVQ
jgi:hypothetical protein